MHPGVDARVGHERGERAERDPRGGDAVATPVANAKADAEWPDGNEVERGIATWRATGTGDVAVRSPAAAERLQDDVHDRRREPARPGR